MNDIKVVFDMSFWNQKNKEVGFIKNNLANIKMGIGHFMFTGN
jgi:hypothetical protein